MTVRREVSDFAALIEELVARVERLEEALATSATDENGPLRTPWLTRQQAAEYVPISPRQFDRLHKEGRIEAHRGTGRPLFHIDELDAMVRSFGTLPQHPLRDLSQDRSQEHSQDRSQNAASPPLKGAESASRRRARDEP